MRKPQIAIFKPHTVIPVDHKADYHPYHAGGSTAAQDRRRGGLDPSRESLSIVSFPSLSLSRFSTLSLSHSVRKKGIALRSLHTQVLC